MVYTIQQLEPKLFIFPISIIKIRIKEKLSEISSCTSEKYLTNVAKVKDYGRNRGNKSQPVFYGEEEGDPLVFRVYNFQTTLFSASEFSITIHANWMKKRFDARIPYCPRGNIFRPWNRIVIDHGCDSHAFHTHARTHTRDTRWIFSCSFELMKHADYQTLRHILKPTPAQTHPS